MKLIWRATLTKILVIRVLLWQDESISERKQIHTILRIYSLLFKVFAANVLVTFEPHLRHGLLLKAGCVVILFWWAGSNQSLHIPYSPVEVEMDVLLLGFKWTPNILIVKPPQEIPLHHRLWSIQWLVKPLHRSLPLLQKLNCPWSWKFLPRL